jgi:membrane fusion protein (multidrug efflux system)
MRSSLLVLTVATAVVGCAQPPPPARKATSVVVRRPERLDLPVLLRYPAELKPLRETDVQPLEVHGYVTKLLVDRGSAVKAGQRLAELDCSAYADDHVRQREALKQIEARRGFANTTLDRLRPMAEQKFLGAQELERAETEAVQAEAARAQAEAAVRTAQTRLKDCALTAPFDGDITERYVDVGSRVGPGRPLFNLVDSTTLRATVYLADRDAGKVRAGQAARLTTDAYPNEVFQGHVERVVHALDRATRTMVAEVGIDNARDLLRPGMFGRLAITVETRPQALLVPAGALLVQEKDISLFVAEGKTARRREVTLGYDDGEWVEVLTGLGPEDLVVLQGKDLLGDGAAIDVRLSPATNTPLPGAPPPSVPTTANTVPPEPPGKKSAAADTTKGAP